MYFECLSPLLPNPKNKCFPFYGVCLSQASDFRMLPMIKWISCDWIHPIKAIFGRFAQIIEVNTSPFRLQRLRNMSQTLCDWWAESFSLPSVYLFLFSIFDFFVCFSFSVWMCVCARLFNFLFLRYRILSVCLCVCVYERMEYHACIFISRPSQTAQTTQHFTGNCSLSFWMMT